tara:strand:- start:13 stop:267 length:255 start_codon:yes stop_codon:yes gene_type:complete
MKREGSCILNAMFFAVILNLVIPLIATPFATPEEIKPSCPSKLSFKSQVMHMLVHHRQTPVASSLVVALIVGLALYLGYLLKVF